MTSLKGAQVAKCERLADLHERNLAAVFKSLDEELLYLITFVRLGPDGPGACAGAAVGGGMRWGAKFPPLTRPKGVNYRQRDL